MYDFPSEIITLFVIHLYSLHFYRGKTRGGLSGLFLFWRRISTPSLARGSFILTTNGERVFLLKFIWYGRRLTDRPLLFVVVAFFFFFTHSLYNAAPTPLWFKSSWFPNWGRKSFYFSSTEPFVVYLNNWIDLYVSGETNHFTVFFCLLLLTRKFANCWSIRDIVWEINSLKKFARRTCFSNFVRFNKSRD